MIKLLTSFWESGYTIYDFFENVAIEVWSSLIIIIVICIVAVILGRKAKRYDPLTRPKSALIIFGEYVVGGISDFVETNMGTELKHFIPYFTVIVIYLPFAFLGGLFGLPSPLSNIAVPLSLAIITFVCIHATAIKFQGFKKWLHRFIEPIPFFLPVNLLTVWSIVISLTCRILGNVLAGGIILTLIYWGTALLSEAIFSGPSFNFIGPFAAPVFHAYFDVFGSYIQTTVFLTLSAMFIAKEVPKEE